MRRPTRTEAAVATCLGVITAGTITAITMTSEPEQTEQEAVAAIYGRYSDAVEKYASDFASVYGGSTASGDVTFCVRNYGESDEELLNYAYRNYSSSPTKAIQEWYAVTHAYGVCSTF